MRHTPTRGWTWSLASTLALALVLESVWLTAASWAANVPTTEAAFPGANGRIAFHSNRVTEDNAEGDFEIFTMTATGGSLQQLTKNSADDFSPAWSADGEQIAFQSIRDGNWEIYTMNADGGGQTNRTGNAARDELPAWSPDGTQIAFMRRLSATNDEIFVMSANGGSQDNLTENPRVLQLPILVAGRYENCL
jgi:Tol biopolymer transport system component